MSSEAAPLVSEAESRPQSLAGKTAWAAGASLINTACFALSSLVVARALGPTGTGEIAYSLWLAATLVSVIGFGLPQATTRYVAELLGGGHSDTGVGVGRWLVRRGVVLVLLGVAPLLAVEWSRGRSCPPAAELALIAAMYVSQGLVTLYTAALAGCQDFRRATSVNLWSAVAQLACVTLGALSAGVAGATAGYVAGALVAASACARWAAGHAVKPDAMLLKRIRRFSFETWLATTISLVLWSRTEIFFIERYRGAHEVAMFTIGLSFAQLATQGPLMFGAALLPHFAQLAGARDLRRLGETYAALTRLIGFLVLPMCFGVAALCPILVPRLFGAAFAPAAGNAAVLVAAAAVGAISSVGSSAQYALERARFIATAGAIGAAAGLVVFVFAIQAFGAAGAAWGRSLVQFAMVAAGFTYSARVLRLPVPLASLSRMAVSALAAAIPGIIASRYDVGLAQAFLVTPLMAGVYLVAIRVTGALTPTDVDTLERAASRLPRQMGSTLTRIAAWSAGLTYGS